MFNPSLSHRQTLKNRRLHILVVTTNQSGLNQTGPSSPGCTDFCAITLPAHPFLLINNVKEL